MKYYIVFLLGLRVFLAHGQHSTIDKNHKENALDIRLFFEKLSIDSSNLKTIKFDLLVKQNCFIELQTVLNEMRFKDSNYYAPFFKDLNDLNISKEAKIISSFKLESKFSSYLIEDRIETEFYGEVYRYLINISNDNYTIFQVTYCQNSGLSAILEFARIEELSVLYFRTSQILDMSNSAKNEILIAEKELDFNGSFK